MITGARKRKHYTGELKVDSRISNIKNCLFCGCELPKPPRQYKSTCSKECNKEFLIAGRIKGFNYEKLNCEFCGKEFYKTQYNQKMCSTECNLSKWKAIKGKSKESGVNLLQKIIMILSPFISRLKRICNYMIK